MWRDGLQYEYGKSGRKFRAVVKDANGLLIWRKSNYPTPQAAERAAIAKIREISPTIKEIEME